MSHVRVGSPVAEPDAERAWTAEDFADLYDLNSTFGRLAAEARAEYFRAGGKPLDQAGIAREVANRRSGDVDAPDQ